MFKNNQEFSFLRRLPAFSLQHAFRKLPRFQRISMRRGVFLILEPCRHARASELFRWTVRRVVNLEKPSRRVVTWQRVREPGWCGPAHPPPSPHQCRLSGGRCYRCCSRLPGIQLLSATRSWRLRPLAACPRAAGAQVSSARARLSSNHRISWMKRP